MSRARPIVVALSVALAAPIARGSAVNGPASELEPPDDAPTDAAPDERPSEPPSEPPNDSDAMGDPSAEAGEDDAGEDEPDVDAPPAPRPEPRPRRYVWGDSEIDAARPADATAREPDASRDTNAAAPGGYLGPTETKEVAPKDGERKLLVAYIVLPLGTLAMVSGAVATWLTHPDHCRERLGRYGDDLSPGQCRGLWILNIVRTTYGSMMMVSGAVLLGLGLRERKRYREWKAKHGAYVQPRFGRAGGGGSSFGLVLGGRF